MLIKVFFTILFGSLFFIGILSYLNGGLVSFFERKEKEIKGFTFRFLVVFMSVIGFLTLCVCVMQWTLDSCTHF